MYHTHPADLSPLSYGTGLALGVLMLLGLPAAPGEQPESANAERVGRSPARLSRVDPAASSQTIAAPVNAPNAVRELPHV